MIRPRDIAVEVLILHHRSLTIYNCGVPER